MQFDWCLLWQMRDFGANTNHRGIAAKEQSAFDMLGVYNLDVINCVHAKEVRQPEEADPCEHISVPNFH